MCKIAQFTDFPYSRADFQHKRWKACRRTVSERNNLCPQWYRQPRRTPVQLTCPFLPAFSLQDQAGRFPAASRLVPRPGKRHERNDSQALYSAARDISECSYANRGAISARACCGAGAGFAEDPNIANDTYAFRCLVLLCFSERCAIQCQFLVHRRLRARSELVSSFAHDRG